MKPIVAPCVFASLLLMSGSAALRAADVFVGEGDVQEVVDAAPDNSIVRCDPNRLLVLSNAVVIRKPLALVGLRARLPEKLGNRSLLIVKARGVAVTDFELTGNGDTVSQNERAPLLIVHAGDFRIERGLFLNSSKDGVMIDGDGADGDIVGGLVRDIVGRNVIRDTVSISGSSSNNGHRIRNVLVENVRCYESRLRGAVEVSDGTDNITVRKVFAEAAVYAVDVQDHGRSGQSNRNVVIEEVHAVRCRHALRTANSRRGHANLTVRAVTADRCVSPVQISHTANVRLSDVRVLNHAGSRPPMHFRDCEGISVRDVVMENVSFKGAAILLEDCDEAAVDGFSLRGGSNSLGSTVLFRRMRKEASQEKRP